jgi:hypothetical protein
MRAMLLRTIPSGRIEEIDWGYIRVRTRAGEERRSESRTIRLGSPFAYTKREFGHLFQDGSGAVSANHSTNGGQHAGA